MASPESNKEIARFLDAVGIIMITSGFEWIVFVDHPSPIVVGGFWLGGTAVFFTGVFWERAQSYIPKQVVQSLEAVASDIRYWLAFVLIAWLSLFLTVVQKTRVGTTLSTINDSIGAIRGDIKQIRADFDCYVKPRRLKPDQISKIAIYLLAHDSHEITVKVVADDGEASQFSADLSQALRQGGWTVVPGQVDSYPCLGMSQLNAGNAQIPTNCLNPGNGVLCTQVLASGTVEPTPIPLMCSRVADKGATPEGGTAPCAQSPCFVALGTGNAYFTWQEANYPIPVSEGLSTRFVETQEHAQAQPDPKHPDAQALLQEAFRLAEIQLDGGSGGGSGINITKDSLSIIVGRRRRDSYGPGCFKTITKTEIVPAGSDE